MIKCNKLWTHSCDDVHIGNKQRLDDHRPEYMNLDGPQYLQIFRTTIRTNIDELNDGKWLDKARDAIKEHLGAISVHMDLSEGAIIDGYTGQVVGEGSGPNDSSIRPFRIMHGLESFKKHPGYNESWRSGLLFLKGRLIRIMKPWAPIDQMSGGYMQYVRESCWISEVALGFRDDGRWDWQPHCIADAAKGWLEEAATWAGKDFP